MVQAVKVLAQDPIDVVVSDLEMPEKDGYGLIAEIQRTPELSALPVIALTAHAGENERARALAAGFVAHVAKPVGEGVLPALVARVLRGKRRPRA